MPFTIIAVILGFLLDLCFGDPHWMPHPIRFIGILIEKGERLVRKMVRKGDKSELFGGILLAVFVILISTAVPLGILWAAGAVSPYLRFALETLMCYQILATKSLKTESMKVYAELVKGDLQGARKAVAMIVGRDTQSLDESQVTKAAVETVAENLSDGVIAPLLFLAIGGAPLGFLYKAINTMDSMLGYKNETYLFFGRFAAKLDDVANYIPARLSAYLMMIACPFCGMDAKKAYQMYKRDRYNHSSPNSAQTEATCAGALHIQLAGNAYYFGKLYEKPTIGDDMRPIVPEDIIEVNKLMYWTASISVAVFSAVHLAVWSLWI